MTNTVIKQLKKPQNLPQYQPKPRYEKQNGNIVYIALDESGNDKPAMILSDAFEIVGRGIDEQNTHYRIIEWLDKFSHQKCIMTIAQADIGTNECWRKLQAVGITVYSNRRKRDLLSDYLQAYGSNTHWEITSKTGWNKDRTAYIMPNGEVIAKSQHNIIFNGDKSQANGYQVSGTLQQWQDNIGIYLADNTRLCLAVGTALSAPLMRLLDIESGGFHIYGDSSSGKTTCANVGLSVWGKPSEIRMTWTGTSLGFSNAANSHNDNLMMLDEISQASAKVVSMTAYQAINGISKAQGAKDGGNRTMSRWRIMLLSTGEKTLDGYIKSNYADWNAGQNVRLPSIPAESENSYGIYENLHNTPNGAFLSEHLNIACEKYHAAIGYAFIEYLINNSDEVITYCKTIIDNFMALDISGQARRVAMRFALVAATLELATKGNILNIKQGLGISAMQSLFNSWVLLNGKGKYEDRIIKEQAIAFMQQNAYSSRFVLYPDINETTSNGFAGYYKKESSEEQDKFYIVPAVFEEEICKSYDVAKVCNVLHTIKWLQKYETGATSRWKHQLFKRGRFYVLVGRLPPCELEEDI